MGRPIVQWQILAKSPENLAAFYEKLFDWNSNTDNALGYRTVNTNSENGIGGGFWQNPPDGNSMVTLYVGVENVQEYADKAVELGGKIIIPPQMLPDGDEMAVILDPEGIPVGLIKHSKPE